MEFIDYYKILDIPITSTFDGIKAAFKKQALKWHPDRNPNQDTTKMMQLINEASLILKDSEARQRYDLEHRKYKSYKSESLNQQRNESRDWGKENQKSEKYKVEDEVLEKWMKNAKNQAIDLAIKTIKDFKGMSKAGAKAAIEEVKTGLQVWFYMILFIGLISLLITILSR